MVDFIALVNLYNNKFIPQLRHFLLIPNTMAMQEVTSGELLKATRKPQEMSCHRGISFYMPVSSLPLVNSASF
jgi:hypothetical protein